MAKVNIKYKDRLFRLLFGAEEYKENILSLYNAINGTAYDDVNDIRLYTIDDIIYVEMKNDVALILDSYLSLWEQQSTYNPNMPLRGLMYFGKLYDKYIEEHRLNVYGSALVRIPTPSYIVFYNGTDEQPAIKELRLSDAFITDDVRGSFEWTATMYNLNPGKNDDLLGKCRALRDYMSLVNKVRDLQRSGETAEYAVDEAVRYCIDNDIISDVLLSHRAEVVDMCLTEFNEKVYTDGIRAEGRLEGIAAGRKQEREDNLRTITQNIKKRNPEMTDAEAREQAEALLS